MKKDTHITTDTEPTTHTLRGVLRNGTLSYIHTSIHACIHTCIHAYIHACMHACIHAYVQTCINTHIHVSQPHAVRTHRDADARVTARTVQCLLKTRRCGHHPTWVCPGPPHASSASVTSAVDSGQFPGFLWDGADWVRVGFSLQTLDGYVISSDFFGDDLDGTDTTLDLGDAVSLGNTLMVVADESPVVDSASGVFCLPLRPFGCSVSRQCQRLRVNILIGWRPGVAKLPGVPDGRDALPQSLCIPRVIGSTVDARASFPVVGSCC